MYEIDLSICTNECTEDLQHDLALGLAGGETLEEPLNKAYAEELKRRKAPLPFNCRFVYSPYARFKRALEYDLEECVP